MLTNHFSPNYPKIVEFLSKLKIIRIFMDSMFTGVGNQANTLNIMKRLRELGFVGKFELIYSKCSVLGVVGYQPVVHKNANKKKIANLFNLPEDFSDLYYDSNHHIEFIEASVFIHGVKNGDISHLLLSITGGEILTDIDFFVSCKFAGMEADQANLGSDEFIAFINSNEQSQASMLRTSLHIRISPHLGKLNPKIIFSREGPRQNEDIEYRKGDKRFIKAPVETLQDAFHYLETSRNAKTLIKQTPGLLPLMEGTRNKKFYTLPVYGWPVQLPKYNMHKNNTFFPGNILEYIAAARVAQLEDPKLAKKPIVLPVFYNYSEEIDIIRKVIFSDQWLESSNWWNSYTQGMLNLKTSATEELFNVTTLQNRIKNFFKEIDLANTFRTIDLANPNDVIKFNEIKPNQVILMSVGSASLPMPVFNGLYIDSGGTSLIKIYEGENARYGLLFGSDRPILRSLLPWDLAQYVYGLPNSRLKKSYEEYYKKVDLVDKSKWVARFIVDGQKTNSLVNQYFRALRAEAAKPENDRILIALDEAINTLEKDKLMPPEDPTEEPGNPEPVKLDAHAQSSYGMLTNIFRKLINKAEQNAIDYARSVVNECPSYFHRGLNYWNQQPAEVQGLCCKEKFFQMGNRCIAQPVVSSMTCNLSHYFKK